MPPLDWSVVTSTLLTLVFPAFSLAAAILMIVVTVFRSERARAIGVTCAFLTGIAIGNYRAELVPFFEFETGWRNLFWATVFITITTTWMVDQSNRWSKWICQLLFAFMVTACVTPWETILQRPLVPMALLAAGIANWVALETTRSRLQGEMISLASCLIWGGGSLVILILCHSARFADLALLANCAVAGVASVLYFSNARSNGVLAGLSFYFPTLLLAAALNSYSDVPYFSLGLAAAAPVTLLLGQWKPAGDWMKSRPGTVLCLPLATSFVAIVLAARAEL